jgi:hypothetical protein
MSERDSVLDGLARGLRCLAVVVVTPFTPSTYHLVLAKAAGARARNTARSSKLWNASLCFIIFLLSI